VARSLSERPSGGLVETCTVGHRVDTFATPAGVVPGLIPVTNPVATIIFKILVA